jgi:hypothetical protein
VLLGPILDWGDLGVRLGAPVGRNPFGRAGVHMRLHDVATLLGSPLLPRGERPTDVWLEMQLGTRTMLDFDRSRVRILEQGLAGCCTFDIRNTAELRREAWEHPGSHVTRIAGYPALVSPPGTYWTGWRIQVAWDRRTEVIVLAPRRGHSEAGLIRLIESLHRPRRIL